MRTRGLRAVLLFGLVGLPNSGCFGYVPTNLDTVATGEQILLHLTRQGVADLPETVVPVGSGVRGRLMRKSESEVLLRIPIGVQRAALSSTPIGQDVVVPASGIVDVSKRQLSRARTVLTVAGGVASIAVLGYAFGQVNNEGEPEPPPEEGFRAPWISIPLRLWGH